jgi:hypothetical protein
LEDMNAGDEGEGEAARVGDERDVERGDSVDGRELIAAGAVDVEAMASGRRP